MNETLSPKEQDHLLPVLALRGNFVLPSLKEQGSERRLGRGMIKNVIALDDEKTIVCASGGATLFNLKTDEVLWEIDCPAHSGVLSPDGSLLALGGEQGIFLWDLRTGSIKEKLEGHKHGVHSITFSPDGKLVATGGCKEIRLWEVANGREIQRIDGHTSNVVSVAFSPDGRLMVSGSLDDTVRLWEVLNGSEVQRLERHSVHSVVFSPDGLMVASASWRAFTYLSEVATGREVQCLKNAVSIAFSPNGRLVALGQKEIRLWEVAGGHEVRQFVGHANTVNTITFTPDGQLMMSGSEDGTVRLWDVSSGNEKRRLDSYTSITIQ